MSTRVKNTHTASIDGIKPGDVAEVEDWIADMFPLLVKVDAEPEAEVELGSKDARKLLRETYDLDLASSYLDDPRGSVSDEAARAIRRITKE